MSNLLSYTQQDLEQGRQLTPRVMQDVLDEISQLYSVEDNGFVWNHLLESIIEQCDERISEGNP